MTILEYDIENKKENIKKGSLVEQKMSILGKRLVKSSEA